ncbi:hypothetical protein IJG98_03240 [Candidatus Saccharibacteria bacterium]|nr:hypothetical protein [Candidatus Saccharibacteria bacterium]
MRKKILAGILSLAMVFCGVMGAEPALAVTCGESSYRDKATLLGMKAWYYYLQCDEGANKIEIADSNFKGDELTKSIWLVGLTILTDLFFAAGMIAVVLIIVSGIKFITSSGDAGAAAKAKSSLVGTIVGLVIVLAAHLIVNTILGLWG